VVLIIDVASANSLTIYPAYGGSACTSSAYVAVPSAGTMQLTAGQHRPIEGGSAGWNSALAT
jgi:hypothetical protein